MCSPTPRTWFASFAVAAIMVVTTPVNAAPPERTLTFDVIELVAGRQVEGRAEIAVERDGLEYRFATEENRAAFERDPRAFEIADGGACGRMGPLAGLGDARRFHVHEGRVYFFASDGCREGFKKNPEKCIERADPRPESTPEERAAGASVLDRWVAWSGGAEALRNLKTYRASTSAEKKSGDRSYQWTFGTAAHFPDRFMIRESWDESWFSTVRAPEGAAMASSRGLEPIAPTRAEAFDRLIGRMPIAIVKAWVDQATRTSSSGTSPKVEAIGDGDGEIAGVRVNFVKVWMNGSLSRFAVDAATGRPVQQSFHARDGGTIVGDVVRTFTSDATVDGVRLPTAWTATMDGKESPAAAVKIDRFEVNPTLGEELFIVRN